MPSAGLPSTSCPSRDPAAPQLTPCCPRYPPATPSPRGLETHLCPQSCPAHWSLVASKGRGTCASPSKPRLRGTRWAELQAAVASRGERGARGAPKELICDLCLLGGDGFRQSCVCNTDMKNRMNAAPTTPQGKGVGIFPGFGLTAGHWSFRDTDGVADRTWGVFRMPGFQFENWDRFLANWDEWIPLKQSVSSTPLAGPA